MRSSLLPTSTLITSLPQLSTNSFSHFWTSLRVAALVKSYTNNSPTGQSFYITEGIGDNAVFLGFDKGVPTRLSETEMRDDATVQKIRNGEPYFA